MLTLFNVPIFVDNVIEILLVRCG